MSGGVDSATCAALLLREGYQVKGVTALFHDDEKSQCAIQDAKAVCDCLGISQTVVSAQDLFNETVISPFCEGCKDGLTPSPCVLCNRDCKLPVLYRAADDLGCDYVATGHYAQRVYDDASRRWSISRAYDASKDQSYMLSLLSQSQIEQLRLPLGSMEKSAVRALAASLNIPVAQRNDSQDLCFIAGDYRDFLLSRGIVDNPGPIMTLDGQEVGTHQGLHRYTLGQRKGLGVAMGKPFVVVKKDLTRNALVIACKDQAHISSLEIDSVNLLAFDSLPDYAELSVKIRYRTAPTACKIKRIGQNGLHVTFKNPQDLTAPGQIAAFYQNDVLVAAGVISRVSIG